MKDIKVGDLRSIEVSEQERVAELAPKLEVLLRFAGSLIPDLDLLERTYKLSSDKVSMAYSCAPILGAMGKDFQDVADEAQLHEKRAEAICNLIRVLHETELDRTKRRQKKEDGAKALSELMRIFS